MCNHLECMEGARTNNSIYVLLNKVYEWSLASRALTDRFYSQRADSPVMHTKSCHCNKLPSTFSNKLHYFTRIGRNIN